MKRELGLKDYYYDDDDVPALCATLEGAGEYNQETEMLEAFSLHRMVSLCQFVEASSGPSRSLSLLFNFRVGVLLSIQPDPSASPHLPK